MDGTLGTPLAVGVTEAVTRQVSWVLHRLHLLVTSVSFQKYVLRLVGDHVSYVT